MSAGTISEDRVKTGAVLPNGYSTERCPVCGQSNPTEWLKAPDRLHGRRERYTLLRCTACSVVWLSNPPRPEEMYLHYTDAYHKLISDGSKKSPRFELRKKVVMQYQQSGALLDAGCGSGWFLASMAAKSWELYGIEMSPDAAKSTELRSGAKVFVGDVLNASFSPESFDVITGFDVLEHLSEPRQIMAKLAAWLKPGGILYIQVPNTDSAEARVFGTYWQGLELPRHLFHYSPTSLKVLAESAGLGVVSLDTRRNATVGTSLRYVWDDVFRALKISRTPMAYANVPSLPWRAGRKLVRATVLRALLSMAPLVGGGEAIHAVFQKNSDRRK